MLKTGLSADNNFRPDFLRRLQGIVNFPFWYLVLLICSPDSFSLFLKVHPFFWKEDEIANYLLKKKIVTLLFFYQNLQIGGWKVWNFFCCKKIFLFSFPFFQDSIIIDLVSYDHYVVNALKCPPGFDLRRSSLIKCPVIRG